MMREPSLSFQQEQDRLNRRVMELLEEYRVHLIECGFKIKELEDRLERIERGV